MELYLYSSKARKISRKVKLDDLVFKAKINEPLMRMAIHVHLFNQRQSTAHTKIRSEVRGGGKKPWRQKGTGRARHGSIRSPIWKGGGVVFGPRKVRNYKRKLSKKMKKLAIRSAFSYFAKQKQIVILERLDFSEKRLTKQVVDLTDKLPVEGKVLYIHKGNLQKLYLGSRNLKKINVASINEVNVYKLLDHNYLIILEDTLEDISKFWGKGESKKGISKDKVTQKGKETKERKKIVSRKEESLESLGLETRILTALQRQSINTSSELVKTIEKGEKIKGIGEASLIKIREVLKIKSK